MLMFMFEKNGNGWFITDPNRHDVQHFHCVHTGKAWDYAIREITKRVNGTVRFTLVVEMEDGATESLPQSLLQEAVVSDNRH